MRHLSKIAMVLTFGVAAAGCFVATDPGPYNGPSHGGGGGGGTGTPSPALDAPVALGLRGMVGYHVSAGSSAALPDGDLGFIITANGQGGYRVTWSDTYGSAAHFAGSITTDGYFDRSQVAGYSGAEYLTLSSDDRVITFDSTPGSYVDGVDLVSTTDPIYLDLTVDGQRSGFGVYFTGAQTRALINSAYVPVAFTSP